MAGWSPAHSSNSSEPGDLGRSHRASRCARATWLLQFRTRQLQYNRLRPQRDPGGCRARRGMGGDLLHGSSENIVTSADPGADRLRVLVHSRSPRRDRVSGVADPGRPGHSALALVGIWRTWDFPAVVDRPDRGRACPVSAALHLHRAAAAVRGLRLEDGRRRAGHGRRMLRVVLAPQAVGCWAFLSAWACSGWVRSCCSASRSCGSGRGPA